MTVALKSRANIFLLNIGCFCAGLCEKAIEAALSSRFLFVLFSVFVAALTVAAIAGVVIGIVNVVAVFQKMMDVFRDVSAALFG